MSSKPFYYCHQGGEVRLDRLIKDTLPQLSRKYITFLFEKGSILRNGRKASKGELISPGDEICIWGDEPLTPQVPAAREALAVKIVAEDDLFLIVEKGAGVHCQMLRPTDDDTLINYLVPRYPELLGVGGSVFTSGVTHRLDRDTSGLVLVARRGWVYDYFREEFRSRRILKFYTALVAGTLRENGEITSPLQHHPKNQRKMQVADGYGRVKTFVAHTEFWPIGHRQGQTLLKIRITTGVTHQIRVHLASIGHPIVGDSLYGDPRTSNTPTRLHLHASKLSLRHPQDQKICDFESPAPFV